VEEYETQVVVANHCANNDEEEAVATIVTRMTRRIPTNMETMGRRCWPPMQKSKEKGTHNDVIESNIVIRWSFIGLLYMEKKCSYKQTDKQTDKQWTKEQECSVHNNCWRQGAFLDVISVERQHPFDQK
jgi:hypothetical protein